MSELLLTEAARPACAYCQMLEDLFKAFSPLLKASTSTLRLFKARHDVRGWTMVNQTMAVRDIVAIHDLDTP